MKISSIAVDSWATGRIMVTLESGVVINIGLTEDESERFHNLAREIFTSRQKTIANEIATGSPLLGDFREVAPE